MIKSCVWHLSPLKMLTHCYIAECNNIYSMCHYNTLKEATTVMCKGYIQLHTPAKKFSITETHTR